jgi:hypothetical protein
MSDLNNDFQTQEIIKKLELLRDMEAEKPIDEMDASLVMACVELILELRGETETLSPEEVEEKVRKIPFVDTTSLNTTQNVKSRATKVKSRKILLIAAVISLLVTIFTVSSIAYNLDVFEELKNKFGTVANTPINDEIDVGGISVYMYGENKDYDSIENAIKSINLDVLYPSKLPDDIVLEKITLHTFDSKEKLVFSFDNIDFTYTILFKDVIPKEVLSDDKEKIEINDITYYIIDMPDLGLVQVYFEYNDDLYKATYNNKEDLIFVIKNLKESKK